MSLLEALGFVAGTAFVALAVFTVMDWWKRG